VNSGPDIPLPIKVVVNQGVARCEGTKPDYCPSCSTAARNGASETCVIRYHGDTSLEERHARRRECQRFPVRNGPAHGQATGSLRPFGLLRSFECHRSSWQKRRAFRARLPPLSPPIPWSTSRHPSNRTRSVLAEAMRQKGAQYGTATDAREHDHTCSKRTHAQFSRITLSRRNASSGPGRKPRPNSLKQAIAAEIAIVTSDRHASPDYSHLQQAEASLRSPSTISVRQFQ
jgi:hypothetical protein